ncbi:MAG: CHAT domain-containing protein [Planctomycetaceae bacterium]
MTLRIEGQPNWKVTPPRRRRGAPAGTTGGEVLPTFLQDGTFEVVEEARLEGPALEPAKVSRRGSRGGARRAGEAETGLTLTLEQPPGEPYVVVARQDSGSISFHIPQAGETKAVRGGRRGAKSAAPLTVTIPVGGGTAPEETTAAPRRGETRGLVDKAVRVVVLKVANAIADYAMEVLARKLEEQLWKKGNRTEGWVRVELEANGLVTYRPGLPGGDVSGRSLLLLHGTFSHTAAAFGDLLGDRDTALRLKALYGDRIFGFDHFTISKTPGENVAGLLAALPEGRRLTCDVITHSRGGLVLRTLHQELTRGSHPDPRVTLGRVVLVASPNGGTPLATPERWEQTLGRFANLLEMFPENPFTTAAGWISGSLSWLAQGLNRNLPGIQAMDANGKTIQDLAKVAGAPGEEWSAVISDTQVPAKMGLAARLGDLGVDGFFQGANDLVVPTDGGRQWGADLEAQIPNERVGRFAKQGGNLLAPADALVMHTTLFAQSATQKFIADTLQTPAIEAAIRGMLPPSQLPTILPGFQTIPESATEPSESKPAPTRTPDEVKSVPTTVASPPVMTIRTEADAQAWSRQDSLEMIVLELPLCPEEALQTETSGMGQVDEKVKKAAQKIRRRAQLLAMYGGASVVVPFHLFGEKDNAGRHWQEIIGRQISISKHANTGKRDAPTADEMEHMGELLFDKMFPAPVRQLYDQARYRERSRKLNVIFTSMIPWVANLPWEFAFDNMLKEYVSVTDVRFVRGVLTPVASDWIETKVGSPLRILLVGAQPGDQAQLDLSKEVTGIQQVLSQLEKDGLVTVDLLPNATIEDLHDKVREARYGEIDVVHFMGHGDFDEEQEEGCLLFNKDDGGTDKVPTEHLCAILRSRGIKVVFLNACQSAHGGFNVYNKGVGPGLVAGGIPAVVANQYSVFDNAATRFARVFYRCLAQGLALGDAAREARIGLRFSDPNSKIYDWGVPVLFTRIPDAVLCSRR